LIFIYFRPAATDSVYDTFLIYARSDGEEIDPEREKIVLAMSVTNAMKNEKRRAA